VSTGVLAADQAIERAAAALDAPARLRSISTSSAAP
jgi:hypothetical protein